MTNLLISLVIFGVAILLSALFSGSETGLYQLSRLRLRLAQEKGHGLAQVLTRAVADRSGLLTALLLGNNLTIQVATVTVTTVVLGAMQESLAAEWVAMAITTPILFVFAELLPKNVFLYRADSLMLWVSPLLYGIYRTLHLCGAIQIFQWLTKRLTHFIGTPASAKALASNVRRHEIRVLLQDSHEEGFLSNLQTGIMNRMVNATVMPVKEVMTRLSRVERLPINSTRAEVLAALRKQPYTRILVYESKPEEIVGRVNVYEVLGQADDFTDLRAFVKPLQTVADKTPVTDAIETMQQAQKKMLLVTHTTRHGQVQARGIVTMKDLAEELLGELATW